MNENYAHLLFPNCSDSIVRERQKEWLLEELYNSQDDIEKCKRLVETVIAALPEWKIDFLLEFLKINKSIDDFKKLHLFPMSSSWNGSQVPLIIEEISFLQSLIGSIKGVDYINHINYLYNCCRVREEYKKTIEIREYLENI